MLLTQPVRICLPFLVLCMLSIPSAAQRIITNNAGERVVIYPDGTWRNAEPGDSLLLKNNTYLNEEIPTDELKAMTKGERYAFLVRQWTDLYAVINLEKIDVQKNFRDATNTKFKASEELLAAESNKKLIEPDLLEDLQTAYDESVNTLKAAKKQQKSIKKLAEKAEKTNAILSKLSESKFKSIRNQYNQYLKTYSPRQYQKNAGKLNKVRNPKHQDASTKILATAGVAAQLQMAPEMVDKKPDYAHKSEYLPKPYTCTLHVDTIDQEGGVKRLETERGLLFTFTEPELRPYFKDRDLMKCRATLSKLDKYVYLTVDFQIASSHSQNNFGALQKGSLLRFLLMNEETVLLYNQKSNQGRIDPYTGHTIFTGQYQIGKKELKALKKSGVDIMRVMWSTGFEDYDVLNIDLLINQIECLEKGS